MENKVEMVIIRNNDFKSLVHMMLKDFIYAGNTDDYMEYQSDDKNYWEQAFEKLNAKARINSIVLVLRDKAHRDNSRGDFSMMVNLELDDSESLSIEDYCDFMNEEAHWCISFTEGVKDTVMTVVESY